ncbi:hypothetical protein ILUMI_20415 [Ignelater luminosus]|uniref:G-protein coupled receptors family 1 profile domain-containing protein n=1 Tax=Ignelater luminosus TaxID=2038154 RepID=A0A8K0FYZ2_IGNLU|nr:hypothetical protein ILUMI_20415 [Ignelater luminosus]
METNKNSSLRWDTDRHFEDVKKMLPGGVMQEPRWRTASVTMAVTENVVDHRPRQVFGEWNPWRTRYLGNNPLHYIPSDLFYNLEDLASLPLTDGVSSAHHLLEKPVLRYATWITCLIACAGNISVIWGRLTVRDENRVLSFVVRNLAASDLLMGIYLLIIGFHDVKFRNIYNKVSHQWMSSWLCTTAGILAMTSSEVSVLLLVFMSVERCLLITAPFGHLASLTLKPAFSILFSIWTVGIGLAVIPVIEFYSSTRFYGVNSLCFPLHISDPFFLGWKYSAIIMLGVNSASLIIIAVVYCVMFISIWKTRHATSLPLRDFEFAIRFFFIVLTDASCWFPIILVKVFALTGMEISADLYAWLVVFVLPVNSAVNPLLYTFTTPKYRSKINKVAVPLHCIRDYGNMVLSDNIRRQSPQSHLDTGSTPTTSRCGQKAVAVTEIKRY